MTQFAGAMALGATDDEDLAERVAGAMALRAAGVGVNVDYAPVCDVAFDPANPALGIRSFGDDPEAVGRLAAATVRGLQDDGVAATVKHFPGAGDTAADPHHELPVVRRTYAQLAERELIPFRAALDAGARIVMTGHLSLLDQDDDVPASLSPAILRDLVRGQLGFEGVTVTDALDMKALAQGSAQIVDAIAALRSGEDVLLGTTDEPALRRLEEGLAQAQRRGLIDAERRRRRDGAGWTNYAAGWAASTSRRSRSSRAREHQALAAELARRSMTLVRNDDGLLPLRLGRRRADRGRPVAARGPDSGRHVLDACARAWHPRSAAGSRAWTRSLLPAAPERSRHRRSR